MIEVDLNENPFDDLGDYDEETGEKLVLKVVKQDGKRPKKIKYYYGERRDEETPFQFQDALALPSTWHSMTNNSLNVSQESYLSPPPFPQYLAQDYNRIYGNHSSTPRVSMVPSHSRYHLKSISKRAKRTFDTDDFDYNYDEDSDKDEPSAQRRIDKEESSIRKDKKAVFSVPRRPPISNYTKWSKWSRCSAKCTTRRFKRCRVSNFCGNDVIREVAYCYTEGSFCHEWIGSQLHKMNQALDNEAAGASTYNVQNNKPGKGGRGGRSRKGHAANQNAINGNRMTNNRRSGSEGLETNGLEFDCGIPAIRDKRKNNVYNMLRIIGGKTARKGQWPWQVAILNRFKEAFCGGTLISPYW